MTLFIPHTWIYFSLCLADVVITTRIMAGQGKHFFYFDQERKPFSMLGLEFPKDRRYFYKVLSGIGKLDLPEAEDVRKNVRAQLSVDFLFMAGAYPGVFLICMSVAADGHGTLAAIFFGLAWCQVVCWLLDITENLYLFTQIKQAKAPSAFGFACYRLLELLKWLPSGGGFIAAIIMQIIQFINH